MARHLELVALVLMGMLSVSFAGLLSNGDFEEPAGADRRSPSSSSSSQQQHRISTQEGSSSSRSRRRSDDDEHIPGWKTKGIVKYVDSGHKEGDMLLLVPQGNRAIRLGKDASITQTVKLHKGNYYALTFSFARTCSQDEKLQVSVSSSSSSILPLQTIYTSVGFDSCAWGFVADSDDVDITLHHPPDNDDDDQDHTCGPIVDTIAVNSLKRPRPTNANLVKNGGFEEGPYVPYNSSWGVIIPPHNEDVHSPLPAWKIESTKAVRYIDAPHFFVPKGKRALELVSGMESVIAQNIRTTYGKTYVLTFLVADAGRNCVGPLTVEARAGKYKVAVTYNSNGKGAAFTTGKLVFKADHHHAESKSKAKASTTTNISFMSLGYNINSEGSLCGPVIDQVKVVSTRYPRRLAL